MTVTRVKCNNCQQMGHYPLVAEDEGGSGSSGGFGGNGGSGNGGFDTSGFGTSGGPASGETDGWGPAPVVPVDTGGGDW